MEPKQTMKTGTEHNRRIAARKPQDRRAVLLGSAAIPAANAHPDAEILDLGQRRAELIQRIDQPAHTGHEAAPLLIERKEVDHLIMELQPKTAAGLAVQLSVIWRQFDLEPGEERGPTADSTLDRAWLWTAMKNAERIGAGAHLAHDRQDTDAPIFAAFDRWADLVRGSNAAQTDEDCAGLLDQADDAALDVMSYEPTTRQGLATQVYVMFHLEHGGTKADHLDIDYSPICEQEGSSSLMAVRVLLDRVKLLGRRNGEADALQRHVKLDEAADCQADAYQLPEEVSRAMQAACARNRAASAEEEVRTPDQAQGLREEALSRFRALKPEDRKTFLEFMRFLSVSSHLHSAMLDFAHKHGMTWEYRRWMEDHLADIPAEQGGANDQHQDADAFADTVATFEAEAPATLALPQEPTGRMVDAGASAAGITPAQFQAAYAAAVEALKLERAA